MAFSQAGEPIGRFRTPAQSYCLGFSQFSVGCSAPLQDPLSLHLVPDLRIRRSGLLAVVPPIVAVGLPFPTQCDLNIQYLLTFRFPMGGRQSSSDDNAELFAICLHRPYLQGVSYVTTKLLDGASGGIFGPVRVEGGLTDWTSVYESPLRIGYSRLSGKTVRVFECL